MLRCRIQECIIQGSSRHGHTVKKSSSITFWLICQLFILKPCMFLFQVGLIFLTFLGKLVKETFRRNVFWYTYGVIILLGRHSSAEKGIFRCHTSITWTSNIIEWMLSFCIRFWDHLTVVAVWNTEKTGDIYFYEHCLYKLTLDSRCLTVQSWGVPTRCYSRNFIKWK